MMQRASSISSNSKLLADRYDELRILKNCNSETTEGGLVNFLYGYMIGNLDIKKYQKIVMNLKKEFNSLKEFIQIYQLLAFDDTLLLIYDFIGEIRKVTTQGNTAKLDQLPALLNINLQEMVNNKRFIQEKWQRQARLQEQVQLNEQYIKKILQEEEKQKINIIKQKQAEGWECQVCLTQIDPSSMGILECGHIFHPYCLNGFLKAQIQSNNVNIRCPMEDCSRKMQTNDILNYIDGELRQKYEKFSFNKFVQGNIGNFSWCPTAGCSAVFQFDQVLDNYRCPACNKHYCLKCRCQYHVGMSCAQYRINNSFDPNDQKFIKFVKGAKFKQCPKCKYWVERNQGCPTMSCKCGQKFCYDCGGVGCPHGSCSNSGKEAKGFLDRLFG